MWLHLHMPAHTPLFWCMFKIAFATSVYNTVWDIGMEKMKEKSKTANWIAGLELRKKYCFVKNFFS